MDDEQEGPGIAERLARAVGNVVLDNAPGARSTLAVANAVLGTTGTDRLADGQAAADREDVAKVAGLERSIAALDRHRRAIEDRVTALAIDVRRTLPTPGLDFLAELARLGDEKGVSWDELRGSDGFSAATRACVRAALEDPDPAAFRPLARLAFRFKDAPRSRRFRGAVRLFVELDGNEIDRLRDLMLAAERAWEAWGDQAPSELTLCSGFIDERLAALGLQGVSWESPARENPLPPDPRSALIGALLAHVASPPDPRRAPHPLNLDGTSVALPDTRVLELARDATELLLDVTR